MAWIPLWTQDDIVSDFAQVDDEDVELLTADGQIWSPGTGGYAGRYQNNARVYMHRALLGLGPRDGPVGIGLEVDHVNGDRLDNRRANLRLVTHAQNQHNRRAFSGSSRHRGVSWDSDRGKWAAKAQQNGKTFNLGRFKDEDEAARVASAWRREHWPYSEMDRAA